MLSSTSEKKLRYVRAFLLLGWCLLIASLFWDPISAALTDPANAFSPFAPWISAIEIQGKWVDQNPYPLGNRIFWTILVPLLPISFMVFGHETWRRICPLSFVSQIPGYLGLRRFIKRLDRQSGKIDRQLPLINRNGWLAKNALWVQLALLGLGLCMRLWFANSDRIGLACMLIGIIFAAFCVGILWGGKTWCHYFCPVGVVQRIYTEPGGLLDSKPQIQITSLPQSMCRQPGRNEDLSACVGCAASCPDIDLEKSYWDGQRTQAASLRSIYFGFLGLIWGFYLYFYLYSGNWLYYFSGIWSHEDDALSQLMEPGLFIDDVSIAIPKLFAVPLVLLLCVGIAILLGNGLARFYIRQRQKANEVISIQTLNHQILIVTAYLAINSFYLFGGRPTLNNFPQPVAFFIGFLIVCLSTLWMMRSLPRSEGLYKNEGLAPRLLKQLKAMQFKVAGLLGTRSLEDLSPDEVCILAASPALQDDQTRLASYRQLLEEFARDGSPQLLNTVRDAQTRLHIALPEHQAITRELRVHIPYGGLTNADTDGRLLALMSFRQSLQAELVGYPKLTNAIFDIPELGKKLDQLKTLHAVSESEWLLIRDELTTANQEETKLLLARIEELASVVSLRWLLRRQRGIHRSWDLAANLMQRESLLELKQILRRVFAILFVQADIESRQAYLSRIAALSGDVLEEVLAEAVPTHPEKTWYEALETGVIEELFSSEPANSSEVLLSTTSFHQILNDQDMGVEALQAKIILGDDCLASVAFVLLNEIDAHRAQQLAHEKIQSSSSGKYSLLQSVLAQHTSLDHPSRHQTLSEMDKFLYLANASLFAQVPLPEVALISQQSQSSRYAEHAYIFHEGDSSQFAVFVVEGNLAVEKSDGKILATLNPGALTGELGVLTGKTRMAALRVSSLEAVIIKLEANDLNQLIEGNARVAASILKTVAGYI